MANVPTITLCWTTRERLPAAQNVRVVSENTAQNAIKTISGPNVGVVTRRPNPPIMRFGLAALITLIDPFSFGYSIASLACGILRLRRKIPCFFGELSLSTQ